MADADVTIKDGASVDRKVDTRTVGAGTDEHRQVVVIGDPTTAANVTPIDSVGNVPVILKDAAGAAIPAGTQYVGDAAATATPTGTMVMGRASAAVPSDVSADNDAAAMWVTRKGAQIVAAPPHFGLNADPFSLQPKTAQYTTTQTGIALWTPTGGKKLVITSYQIQVGGTTAGTIQLWFGASGDTTYTRGTDRAIFDGEFAPSATLKPGAIQTGVWIAGAADDVLRVTDSAAINPLTVTVWGYEI